MILDIMRGRGADTPRPLRRLVEGASVKRKPTPEARFWAKVARGSETECWPWTASTAGGGYGQFGLRAGSCIPAHRFAWVATHGPILDGLWVLHRCDNRPCCNPAHLFLGTRQDNMDDMVAKRRHWAHRGLPGNLGEQNGRAKLTAEQVREIRKRHADGESQSSIARDYPVGRIKVGQIVRGESWRHLLA